MEYTIFNIIQENDQVWQLFFSPHKLPKSQKISNMHISDIQCIYNWSAKHQIPTLKTVVHCIICSITHKLKPTSRIYVQMIYKSSTSYLEHCRRRYPYRGRLPAVFNISITGFFLWKTRLEIEIKKQNCNFNMSLIFNQGNLLLFESKFKCYPIIALHCINNKKILCSWTI